MSCLECDLVMEIHVSFDDEGAIALADRVLVPGVWPVVLRCENGHARTGRITGMEMCVHDGQISGLMGGEIDLDEAID